MLLYLRMMRLLKRKKMIVLLILFSVISREIATRIQGSRMRLYNFCVRKLGALRAGALNCYYRVKQKPCRGTLLDFPSPAGIMTLVSCSGIRGRQYTIYEKLRRCAVIFCVT